MFKLPNFLKSDEQLKIDELTRVKIECENALTMLTTKNMETDDLDDIKSKIKEFKTKYDEFINVYQKAKNSNDSSKLFNAVRDLHDTFNPLEEKFIIRYLNHLATRLNGTVQKTNNLKKDFTYYRLENYELKKLGVFSSKTSNHSYEMHGESYNTFGLLKDNIDRYDTEKYYIEVKPEEKKPGGNPRRTRRRKNKKRRSSKQRISKK